MFLNKGADSITAPLSLLHLDGEDGEKPQDHKEILQKEIEKRFTGTTNVFSTFRNKVALLRKELGIPYFKTIFPNNELFELWEKIRHKKEKEMGAKGGKK